MTIRRTLFTDTPGSRRDIFYLKTDIPVDDAALRALREGNRKEAHLRCPAIASAVQMVFGKPVKQVKPGEMQGTFHLIHHVFMNSGEQLIARSTTPGIFERDNGMKLEGFAQDRLADVGLPSLQVYALELSRRHAPFEFMITDLAPGKSLTTMGDAVMDDPKRLSAIGGAMREWHDIPAKGAGLLNLDTLGTERPCGVHSSWYEYLTFNLDYHLNRCASLGAIDARTARQVQDWFDHYENEFEDRPACLLHSDTGNHNVFMEDMRVSAIVDWEDAMAGDPYYDIAFWATFHPTRRWLPFLQGYGIADPSAPEFAVPFTLYFLRATLAKLVHRQRFGYKDVPGRPSGAERLAHAIRLVRETV